MLHVTRKLFNKICFIYLGLIFWAFCLPVSAYSQSAKDSILTELENIRRPNSFTDQIKLKKLYTLKSRMDNLPGEKDSLYATVLTQIAAFEIKLNKDYTSAIRFKNEALQINASGRAGASKTDAIQLSLLLAYDYDDLGILSKALAYYDTTTQLCKRFHDLSTKFLYSKLLKAYLFYRMGDYQKCIEESFDGSKYALQQKDSSYYFYFLNQKAQSHFYLDQLDEAYADEEIVLKYGSVANYPYQVASSLKIKAMIDENRKNTAEASHLFKKSIDIRTGTKDYDQIANDYADWGNFYLNTLHDFKSAGECYANVIKYARLNNDSLTQSKGYINLSYAMLDKKDYSNAAQFTIKAMQYLKLTAGSILENPDIKQLNQVGNKDPVVVLMSNKTLLLFELYKKTKEVKYLDACIKTAHLTDTVITQMRYIHSGDLSKLFWRDKTRDFFHTAIEACYYANDAVNAFYFMEKSRAVLLNDKLNELGAVFQLSPADAKTEQDYKINIAIQQQKLSKFVLNSTTYNEQMLVLVRIKDDFEHFIHSLETKYPAYYNYKYSDKIPGLNDLQKYLANINASFVYYFTTDTTAYMLSITATNAKMTQLGKKNDFNYGQVNDFLSLCADRNRLNTKSNYRLFTNLSNKLYKNLFQPLNIAKGKVIICTDNFLLPFEALCVDTTGKNFLINDYIFSYAYSATYLLKVTRPSAAKGNFIGFAPVSFQTSLAVPALTSSEPALKQSAANYSSSLLFTNKEASRNNFIQNIGRYTVANIFSHASGDNSDREPRLYMQDSLIYLSDLQFLNNPSTRLVILSACQTNVGKHETGEGIYSLARGFASAGIPSVSATLWEADEDMIYKVSVKFNEYLSKGMSKDSALHKAKLDFIKDNRDNGKLLPYYWANIILIGNTAPLELTAESSNQTLLIGIISGLVFLGFIAVIFRKRNAVRQSPRIKN